MTCLTSTTNLCTRAAFLKLWYAYGMPLKVVHGEVRYYHSLLGFILSLNSYLLVTKEPSVAFTKLGDFVDDLKLSQEILPSDK